MLSCLKADALYDEGRIPAAAEAYRQLIDDSPPAAIRDYVLNRLFDIGNYWLNDLREEMTQSKELHAKLPGWLCDCLLTGSMLLNAINLDPSKPLFEEDRAVEIMELIVRHAPVGALRSKAGFLAGSVHFYREEYREADRYFSGQYLSEPGSPLAPTSLELAIICKKLSEGTTAFRWCKCNEIRQLVRRARREYPDLAKRKAAFLSQSLASADSELAKIYCGFADHLRQSGHTIPAYLCYGAVRHAFPSAPASVAAEQWQKELISNESQEHKLDKQPGQ
jgi:tetratricopeptide (TPR) repeat protein